jgi:uncharacterized membrane protein
MYIDQIINPYSLLCLTYIIKYNILLLLLKVFDFNLIILPYALYRKLLPLLS